jgi:rRNA maturation protein Nop10
MRRLAVRRSVIVRLIGGMGNQLFQYAIGRTIAMRHRRTLVLDDVTLQAERTGTTRRAYALSLLRIRAELLSSVQIAGPGVVVRLIEATRGFHSEVLQPCPFAHIYLDGFWQDERYFSSAKERLRRELRLRTVAAPSQWEREIRDARSPVSVHVRRQDYLARGGRHLGFVGKDYYDRAIRLLLRRVPDAHFFVFSDDVQWCRRNLRFARPHSFIPNDRHMQERAHRDFGLMTLCRHFVIANSSYSWWPAWLASRPGSVVVAPRIWFRDVPSDSIAIVPRGWTRL